MFSLIQTTVQNGLDLYKHINWLLRKVKYTNQLQEDMVQALQLWNALAECCMK